MSKMSKMSKIWRQLPVGSMFSLQGLGRWGFFPGPSRCNRRCPVGARAAPGPGTLAPIDVKEALRGMLR